jgi:hypothetical protein
MDCLASAGMVSFEMPKSLNEQVRPIPTRNSCNKAGQAAANLRDDDRLGRNAPHAQPARPSSAPIRPASRTGERLTSNFSATSFDHAYDLAKRLTRTKNAKEHFEYNRHFWDGIFSKAQRPILREVFRQQDDRMTRYWPLLLKLFPPETRPRQQEVLIEIYRKGKIAEAFRAFRKIFLEIVDEVIDHLKSEEAGDSSARKLAKR